MFEETVGFWRSGASPGLGLRRLGMAPPFNIVQSGRQLTSSAWSSVPYPYRRLDLVNAVIILQNHNSKCSPLLWPPS